MIPESDVKKHLAQLAVRLEKNLNELNKPLVIEFSGTPKSGKTTCVEAISKFFRRHNIPVYLVSERASICPISDKHHLFFNAWTGVTSLAQMLEALERRNGIIILDRGVFDSLVWMDFLKTREAVSPTELSKIETFFLLERWVSRIDIVVAISVDPAVALQREFQDQITDLQGSIMNQDILNEYNSSLTRCLTKYDRTFRRIIHIDTTDKKTVEGVTAIAYEVLNTADDLVDEQIAVVKRETVTNHIPPNGVLQNKEDISHFIDVLIENVEWVRRTVAEEDVSLVQLIPVAVIRKDNEILMTTIRSKQSNRLSNRQTVWAGGHARRSDLQKGSHKTTLFRRTLVRELDEELHIHLDMDRLDSLPKAIVWDNTATKSIQHLALVYEYELSKNMAREVLHLRELWETQSKSLFTQFKPIDNELTIINDWESWSVLYLTQVYGLGFPDEQRQIVMF